MKTVSKTRSEASKKAAQTRKANRAAKQRIATIKLDSQMGIERHSPIENVNPFAVVFFAHLLYRALKGEFGINIQRFYNSAITYHRKMGTSFPRPRNSDVPLLNHADAVQYIKDHSAKGLQAGDKVSQRLFDQMMVDTMKAKAKGIRFQ